MTSIPYTSQLYKEDDQIVAMCPELNVSSFGDTAEEAVTTLQEAVTLFLEECQLMGTLEMILDVLYIHYKSINHPVLFKALKLKGYSAFQSFFQRPTTNFYETTMLQNCQV